MDITKAYTNQIVFGLNGTKVTLDNVEPEATLLEYLRSDAIGLTGTKLTCGEGGCGACTVMVSQYDHETKTVQHRAVNACLAPLCSVDSCAVTTVEGIGNTREVLHPIQERLAKYHGSQCGFCTPGIIMAMYALLRTNPEVTAEEIEHNFDGNLCRCTGYRPILDAMKSFAGEAGGGCCGKATAEGGCCMNKLESEGEAKFKVIPSASGPVKFRAYDPTTEPLFPAFLQLSKPTPLALQGSNVAWYRPHTLADLTAIKQAHPEGKIVVGNTEVELEKKFKGAKYGILIATTHIPELTQFDTTDTHMSIGASVTLTSVRNRLQQLVASLPESKTWTCKAMLYQLKWFAGNQIRNVAAIGGNVCNASPISDLNPILVAVDAVMHVASTGGATRAIPAAEFFVGYRKVAMKPEEVLVRVEIPFTREHEYVFAYKQARRRDDDIAIVTAGLRIRLDDTNSNVVDAGLGYGGMAPTTVRCPKTEQKLEGWKLADGMSGLTATLAEDLPLPPNAPGGMIEFRRSLTTSFLFKFFTQVQMQVAGFYPEITSVTPEARGGIDSRDVSAIAPFHRDVSSGVQDFDMKSEAEIVGHPVMHRAAKQQASGEAQYTDDIPNPPRTVHGALILSSKAHAKILSIDLTAAKELPGVRGIFTAPDVQGSNGMGAIETDEELFATDVVSAQGQYIGIVVADTQRQAKAAAAAVKVEYEELPHILTIEEAIEKESFYSKYIHTIEDGDVDAAMGAADHTLTGKYYVGGQEHFYLEPNNCLIVPGEDGEMTVHTSTQNPSKTQKFVAKAVGVPANRVTCKMKRMGGGFGGKETRSVNTSMAAAVAAKKLNRPVRLLLDRDVDMTTTGQRHAFMGDYKVGFTKEGKITALDIKIYSNAGNSHDLSVPVADRALFHVENAYKIPNVRAVSRCCKTNIQSNTAFRGFGGPQSMLICEAWVDRVGQFLGKQPEEIRELNFYQEGDKTHYQQLLAKCNARACWDQVKTTSDYDARSKVVDEFNKNNRWRKRGVSITPVKFGMSFTAKFMNQAGALVHVYTDGTVLVTHGGTEMGQGLHTKMCQVAAKSLGVPVEDVHISETATDKVPNTQPTAASVSSDLNGFAILDACEKINARLSAFRATLPDGDKKSFKELVLAAYFERIDLSAHGFFATPDVGYDFDKHEGTPFAYYVYGAACAEVEIDVLTGDHHVIRADLVCDLGQPLNPALDVGQIEGAFVQGYGLMMLEENVWLPNGWLFTRGPATYKIPSFNDVPVDFRVALLKNVSCERNVYSSKGVGEPPLFLAASVLFATRKAVSSARADVKISDETFSINSPATPERIRMGCHDEFTSQFSEKGDVKSNV